MFKNLNSSALGISGNQSELIELTLTYKFQSMDLDIVDFCNRAKLHGMVYARRLIDSAKMKIGTFSLPTRWEADQETFAKDLEQLKEYAAAAGELGCTRCTAMLAPAGDTLPYHENFEMHRDRLGEICKVLEPAGVKLGLGFHGAATLRKDKAFQFIHEMDALGLLVSMVGAPNLGLIVDLWDIVASGGSIENLKKTPVEQIVSVQLADMPEETPLEELTEEDRLLPGETGRVDCAAVLVALKEMGYEGPVSPTPHRNVFKSNRRDPAAKVAGIALNNVWAAAGLDAEPSLVQTLQEPEVAEPVVAAETTGTPETTETAETAVAAETPAE